MKKILGLDLGTNSIGWALIEQDFENKQGKILGMGTRIIPMGTDKQDYEKGVGITKNAERRTKRTIRKMNKRFKLRRNKLLYVLYELGMLPDQFQFKNGIPDATKIQELELLPIKKGTLQLDSLQHYQLRVDAIQKPIAPKELGKVLYSFNQLRGYSGGNSDDDVKKLKEDDNQDDNLAIKKYEVFTQKVLIKDVSVSDNKFQGRGKNKGIEFNKFNVVVLSDEEEIEGETELQNLADRINQEEELEIRIRRNKKGETTSIEFALPQKTDWRKKMEKTEEELDKNNLHISQLILQDLQTNKWTKIRNRVFLRHRYQAEFDAVWEMQSKYHDILTDCPKEKLEKIACYLFPGESETQHKLRQEAVNGGLKYIIKDQIIYYQRPLKPQTVKPQTELISKCRFEKEEMVLPNTHPLFQEFRCWKQINNLYITSKVELAPQAFDIDLFGNKTPIYSKAKNRKVKYVYQNRFLTDEEKKAIYLKLQTQKHVGFNDVKKIVGIKDEKTEYLNGLNVKAKLIGCDTQITIKKNLGDHYETLQAKDENIVEKIWRAIFDNSHNGSEYDPKSLRVSSIADVLKPLNDDIQITELALKIAQSVKFPRKYSSFSEKAILNILPLMQLCPKNVSEEVKIKFEHIKNNIEKIDRNESVDILTGEIINDLPEYVIDFVKCNPNILEKGGIMEPFAISLVYGKHTADKISAQFSNYHEIKQIDRNLRNPIVEQLANETMQVVKALWKQFKFDPKVLEIRVELARDLKNSAKEREKIYKAQIRNKSANDKIRDRLKEANFAVTEENILKYKLYEQQKYISPYSGNVMEISSFDSYEIDHIVPKSRYFDDSFSNKVLVEGNINNEKSNRTAWEYISQQNSNFTILSVEEYLKHINENFFGKKKKNLLLEKIPTNIVERQLKDTQYISIAVKNELAKVVGSDNVKTSTGEVTDFLRSRWGLKKLFMELTENRFKQMELWDLDVENNQIDNKWVKRYNDKEKHIYEIKNWSKRYDHRHHAIDALVVSLTEQSHIQRLNNLNKYLQDELLKRKDEFQLEVKEDETILEAFFNLEEKRRREIQEQIESSRYFEMPFKDLIEQTKALLNGMIVSIKPKDKLGIKRDNNGKIQLKIKGALHQETNYGKTKDPKTGLLRDTRTLNLSELKEKDIPQIIDEVLKTEINDHQKRFDSMKEAFSGENLMAFNNSRYQKENPTKLKPPVYKVKVWYSNKVTEESTLQRLYDNNNKLSVVTGDNYLFLVMEKDGKRIFDIASLFDSADIAKRALSENNENFKKQILEDYRIKNKEKPEKVLFALQQNDLVYLPENDDDPIKNFDNEELKEWLSSAENKNKFSKRVYKVVKFSGKDCHFVPHNFANVINVPKDLTDEQLKSLKEVYKNKDIPKKELNYVEFGSYRDCSPFEMGEVFVKSLNKTAKGNDKMYKPLKIQEKCVKLNIDWLGNISF